MSTDLSRRHSLKQMGLGALGLAAASAFPTLLSARRVDKLGVALVGLGNYSHQMLGPALLETQYAYLAGIVTGTPEKARDWSEKYDIPAKNIYNYETYDQLADNDDIDVVYVVLPNSMHAEYTIRALEAGKHVICEKPMAMNAAEARQMIAAARKADRRLSIGYRLHYDPYHQEVMRLAKEQTFGELTHLDCSLGYYTRPAPGSWKLDLDMGGGPLYNLAVYPLQAARYLTRQEPRFVTARAFTRREEVFGEIAELVSYQLEFPEEVVCQTLVSGGGYIDRLYASCTGGFFELEPAYNYTGQTGRTSKGKLDFPQVFQQAFQIDGFALDVMRDRPSPVSGEEGLRDMLVLDAIREAMNTGKRVAVGRV